jgi:SAM-dependent methyltransferase
MSIPTALDLGDLRRVTPIDSGFGLGRGKPVDRHYIESFLRQHAHDVRGRVLEVAEDTYTEQFGGGRVTRRDILHVDDSNPRATLIADLADADDVPGDSFDCFICTQTLTYIYDVKGALATIRRILRPGGVLLATVPGISQMSPYDRDRWGEYWRFTAQSLGRLLGEAFGSEHVAVEAYGNVLASTALLQGLCAGDLRLDELEHRDQRYQMLIAGRAVKA